MEGDHILNPRGLLISIYLASLEGFLLVIYVGIGYYQ